MFSLRINIIYLLEYSRKILDELFIYLFSFFSCSYIEQKNNN